MSKIESEMMRLHSLMSELPPEEHKSVTRLADKPAESSQPKVESIPFLWVGEVNEGSPAQEAGLLVGDAVVSYGGVDHASEDAMSEIARMTQMKENYEIKVTVIRKGVEEPIELTLVPKKWSGPGLLGCFLSKNVV